MGATQMPEQEIPAEPTPEPVKVEVVDAPEPEAAPDPKPTETVEFWKQMARKNEALSKANEKRLKEFEDRDLTELQRAQKAAQESAAQLADVQRQNALLAKGIPADLTPPAADAPADAWSAYADQLISWRSTGTAFDCAASGLLVTYFRGGIQELVASGTVTAGDTVVAGAAGTVATLAAVTTPTAADVTNTRAILGVALNTATTGNKVQIQFNK
jgi:hypothetical protein